METQIELLTKLGTDAVQSAIQHYTHWYVVASLTWLAVGVACVFGAVLLWRKRKSWDSEVIPIEWLCALLIIIATLTATANVADLVSPRAKAIHQLLKDARGK
jgi:cell division protein FtsW (lipid II flippase)